jgi:hypothetical protein
MDDKGRPTCDLPNDASLPDKINAFHPRFDNNNIVLGVRGVTEPVDWGISLSEGEVRKVFNQVNTLNTHPFSEHAQNNW